MNLVKNVAGVSASDDDLQIFGGSTGNAASLLAVTLSVGSWQLWFMVQGEWFKVFDYIIWQKILYVGKRT